MSWHTAAFGGNADNQPVIAWTIAIYEYTP